MTELADVLARRIAATGPISIADYMTDCLLHPDHGYYTTRDPFGTSGDFITAPEISQMFGELIGLCLAQTWLDQGAPSRITLAELGPGRGTLMADLLRATKAVPGFHQSAHIHLVEASPALRNIQKNRLSGVEATWHDTTADLPDAPLFLVANEFFDALPIRQFVRDTKGWRERQVGLQDGRLCFGLSAATPLRMLAHRLEDTQPGDLVEHCAQAAPIIAELSRRIAANGGAALIIDYGDWRSLGDTLQAVAQHKTTDPLDAPGMADLTAHVDFEGLAKAATEVSYSRLTTQGVFLERLGITQRAQALASKLGGSARVTHIAAHRRLTHPEEMGSLFKVLGLSPKDARPPPGLEN
jgi:SAM-dependent MidA family methyltransferase